MTLFDIEEILDFPRGGPSEGHVGLQRDLSFADIAISVNKVVNYVTKTMNINLQTKWFMKSRFLYCRADFPFRLTKNHEIH